MLSGSAAPGFNPEAAGLPWWRRAWMQGAGYALPNLGFLALPLWYGWSHLDTGRLILLVVTLVALGAVYLGSTLVVELDEHFRWSWLFLLIMVTVVLASLTGVSVNVAFFNPYVCAAAVLLLPWRSSRVVITCATLFALAIAAEAQHLAAGIVAAMGFVIGVGVGRSLEMARIESALAQAEERTAVLAVAAERERIGRDLHDILGHSLTTIAVKADLASRISAKDVEASKTQIDEIAEIARTALSDVRATASGMKEVRLATELASSRSVLLAAGIEMDAPSALPQFSDKDAETLGYALREAVTNILRHSEATLCELNVTETQMVVSDNGKGIPPHARRSGLNGLEARAREAGWNMKIQSESSGTTVSFTKEDS